jgi:predicted aspartyl protease
MAVTFVRLKVINPAQSKKSKVREFLVDSGAFYTVMPEEDLKALAIKPTSHEDFMLADGTTVRKAVGNALFELHGKVRAAPVIFGGKGIYLLGSTTLEALGLILDPLNRVLKPAPMVLMGYPKGLRDH